MTARVNLDITTPTSTTSIGSVKNSLSPEEKIICYFIKFGESPCLNKGMLTELRDLLLEPAIDISILEGHFNGEIKYNDPRLEAVYKRNPFLGSNCYAIKQIIERMAQKGKTEGLIYFIENPRHFIEHDRGDGKQLGFIFCHELSKKLNCEERVVEEIKKYAKAYEEYWTPLITNRTDGRSGLTVQGASQKQDEVDGYNRCLESEYQSTMRFRLLPGDYSAIEVLANVLIDDLRRYV